MTTDVELDRMYEAALADDWEDRNQPHPGREDAIGNLKSATAFLMEAVAVLKEAQGNMDGSPQCDRIGSLADEVGFLLKDIEKQIERM